MFKVRTVNFQRKMIVVFKRHRILICFNVYVDGGLCYVLSSSLSSSCLQQAREHHSGYPYMFHDPLHSLSSSYSPRVSCNPAVAHQPPPQGRIRRHPHQPPLQRVQVSKIEICPYLLDSIFFKLVYLQVPELEPLSPK